MSPLIAILNLATAAAVYTNVVEIEWSTEKQIIRVSISPHDPEDEIYLDAIQGRGTSYVVAFRRDVALCDLVAATRIFKELQRVWNFEFQITRTDFIPSMEIGFSSTSADKLAELRARRLLLNENPAMKSTDINDITRELFLGGHQTLVRVERSAFPGLYAKFGQDANHFLEIAWIQAMMSLRLAGCVAEIDQLRLTLRDSALDVAFRGKRTKKFINAPAYEVVVEGTCAL